jgi:PAS domain S-box-containing protein
MDTTKRPDSTVEPLKRGELEKSSVNEQLPEDVAPYWLAAIIESAEDAIVSKTLDGIITSWNKGAENLFGYTAEEVIGRSITILIPADRLDEEPAILNRIMAGERIEHYETKRVGKNGKLLDISLTISPIRIANGQIIGASKIARNITARKRAEALIEGQRRALEMIIKGASLRDVLSELARTVEQQLSDRGLVSILLVDGDGMHLRHGAAPSLPEAYNRAVDGVPITPEGGSCVAAAHSKRSVITTDIATDPVWVPYRELALKYGLRACSSLPILSSTGDVLGTFAIYYQEPREPSHEDLQLIQLMIGTAAVAIERKRDEDALARISAHSERQRRLYETALSNTPDLVYIFSTECRFIYANEALLTMWGKSWDEAIGKSCLELGYEPWHAEMHEREIRQVIETRQAVKGEVPFTGTSGRRIYEYIFVPVLGAAGEVEAVAGTTRDVTDRKQNEEERERLINQLEWERERLAYLFDKAPAFVATFRGPNHIFELANSAYYQLVGHRELIGKTVRQVLTEIEGQTFFELLDQVYQTGEPYVGNEVRVNLQREPYAPLEERFLNLIYLPIPEADGTIAGIFAHGIDVTEQVAARKSIEETSRMKDEFLSTLSHELRTPLTAILGWARMLSSGQMNSEAMKKAIKVIERNAHAQRQLIEDILDVSRVISGKLRLEVRPLDLSEVIEAAIDSVLPAANAREIRLQRVLDSGASMVSGDPTRLQQVVWNLLSNAIKFTRKGGRVQIRLERVNSHVEIIVSDSGIGIAPEVLPYVFDRFRQADSSMTRKHGGLGLGLSIVRHLVEMHGGTVEAASEGPGKGSTFTVRLPLIAIRSRELTGEADLVRVHPTTGSSYNFECPPALVDLSVLVVDDEDDARLFVSMVLEHCGAKVRTAKTAAEALEVVKSTRPHVLVSDLGMPEEDGFTLIRKIRELPTEQGGRTPAAALTAYARVEDRMRVLSSGFQIHLPKPVEPAELVAVVANLACLIVRD